MNDKRRHPQGKRSNRPAETSVTAARSLSYAEETLTPTGLG